MQTETTLIRYAQFRDMDFPDDDQTAQYELLNGELARRAAPSPKHQIMRI